MCCGVRTFCNRSLFRTLYWHVSIGKEPHDGCTKFANSNLLLLTSCCSYMSAVLVEMNNVKMGRPKHCASDNITVLPTFLPKLIPDSRFACPKLVECLGHTRTSGKSNFLVFPRIVDESAHCVGVIPCSSGTVANVYHVVWVGLRGTETNTSNMFVRQRSQYCELPYYQNKLANLAHKHCANSYFILL